LLEVSMIASVAGEIEGGALTNARPFRSPHHYASMPALVGGGLRARPGEISLAHNGVLFLDEMPEFPAQVLDSLRQPLESGEVAIARANHRITYPARFMLYVVPVKEDKREVIPAITHVDNSGRLQTVIKETNPGYHRMIELFGEATGVPVVLNTSFNLKGEPIVETPQDAVQCFLTTGIDYLALHDRLVSKNVMHKVLSPILDMYSEVSTMVRTGLQAD
jgi:hypothetical protein